MEPFRVLQPTQNGARSARSRSHAGSKRLKSLDLISSSWTILQHLLATAASRVVYASQLCNARQSFHGRAGASSSSLKGMPGRGMAGTWRTHPPDSIGSVDRWDPPRGATLFNQATRALPAPANPTSRSGSRHPSRTIDHGSGPTSHAEAGAGRSRSIVRSEKSGQSIRDPADPSRDTAGSEPACPQFVPEQATRRNAAEARPFLGREFWRVVQRICRGSGYFRLEYHTPRLVR